MESPRKINIEEPIKPLVPHTREQVTELCDRALDLILDETDDFTDRSTFQLTVPERFFASSNENEEIRANHRAYCQMIFDLCVDLLHEMFAENVQPVRFPEWQKAKLNSKRFFRSAKPKTRAEIKTSIKEKTLEVLQLNRRPIQRSKWRVSANRNPQTEKFELVLEEEIRRTESQWLQYDDDFLQIKFDAADTILDQLVQETITQCLTVVDRRRLLNSHTTRL